MNRMTGILLMGFGGLLIIIGGFVYSNDKSPKISRDTKRQMEQLIDLAVADGVLTKREEKKIIAYARENDLDVFGTLKDARARVENDTEESETEIVDHIKKSGDDFEKYVVRKFNPKYFNVKEWAGDKYVDGIYADTTLHPDLLMELTLRDKIIPFYVECKWRSAMNSDTIQIARPDQFLRYKQFEKEKKIPVFIALGVGGKAGNPESLYILPLRKVSSKTIKTEELFKYQKNININFFYNIEKKLLK